MSLKSSWIFKILIILLGTTGLLCVFEYWFRFANPIDYFHNSTAWAQEQFHHSPRPGSFQKQYGQTTVTYQINSIGLRDNEFSLTKKPGTLRILVLSDSFVFGEGVALEQVWVKILERQLQRSDRLRNIEIINGGIWGYSPLLEYLFFKYRLQFLEPDLVLQCVFSNDISEDFAYSLIAEYDQQGQLLRVPHHFKPTRLPVRPLLNRQHWLFRHSYLIKYGVWLLEEIYFKDCPEIIPGDILTDPFAHCQPAPPAWENHYQRTTSYLKKVADLCRHQNIGYVCTLLPNPVQLNSRRLFNILAATARQNDYIFWDFFEPCHQHLRSHHYDPGHGHLTAAGQRVLADIVYEKMASYLHNNFNRNNSDLYPGKRR